MNEEPVREHREDVDAVEQEVQKISKEEVRKMESGKAVGPFNLAVEVWTV